MKLQQRQWNYASDDAKSFEESSLMLLFTGVVSRCEDHFLKIAKLEDISTLVSWHLEWRDQCCRSLFCWTFRFKRLPVDCAVLSTGEDPVVVHYFITLQPAAAGCVTCSSILICSATRYSFSALLHLIRTDRVPPNNGIMTGTGWFLVLVLSASWPSARASEWESLLTQMWPTYECKGLLVLIEYPHGLWKGFGLVGALTVKCFTQLSIPAVPKVFDVEDP